jgi:parvulin-like peptidyl-prolyl isomerase
MPRRIAGAARRKALLLALPAAVGAAAIAGCGDDVPSGAVAKIGDSTITKAEFTHWLTAAARSQQPPGGGGQVAVPDPPDFASCITAKQNQPAPKGAAKPTGKALKAQCKQEYDQLKGQVMQFLISAEWIQQEADDRGITATDAEVRQRFEQEKKQSFPNDKAYKQFLETSGQTEQDLFFRVKLDVLSNSVREKVVEGKGKVSNEDVTKYYNENKQRFGQPERRDLLVVLTKTEDKANQARKAIEKGDPFKTVAKSFSIDQASKEQGGKLPAVTKGQQEKALDKAVFSAKKGELVGPVKTQFGWYVFKVTKVTAAQQQSLQESSQTIRNLLRSQGEQKALEGFVDKFRKKYIADTNCADGFKTPDCKNGPKQQQGPASGGSPQGGQPAVPGGQPGGVPGAPPGGAPPSGAPGGQPGGTPQQTPPPGG